MSDLLTAINNFEDAKKLLLSELRNSGHETTANAISMKMATVDSDLKAMRFIATQSPVPVLLPVRPAGKQGPPMSDEELDKMYSLSERQPSPTLRGDGFDC